MQQENTIKVDFSTRLQSLMRAKKLNQRGLADIMGLSQAAISKWFQGSQPSAELLLRLSDFFAVLPQWLLTGEGSRNLFDSHLLVISRLQKEALAAYPDDPVAAQDYFDKAMEAQTNLLKDRDAWKSQAQAAEARIEAAKSHLQQALNSLNKPMP